RLARGQPYYRLVTPRRRRLDQLVRMSLSQARPHPSAACAAVSLPRRSLLAGAAVAVFHPLVGRAQQAGRRYRLGFALQRPREKPPAVFDELARRGFVEGGNLAVDPQGFGLTVEQLEAVALEVARRQPDAIYAGGDAAARAAQRATGIIPI